MEDQTETGAEQAVDAAETSLETAKTEIAQEETKEAAIKSSASIFDEIDAFAGTLSPVDAGQLRTLTAKGRTLYG